ncbi:hypothetical protein Btru_045344 [Bulinus truncatus]|nr:hypothetical protein Btru_045344 [Bulinus truncatus]
MNPSVDDKTQPDEERRNHHDGNHRDNTIRYGWPWSLNEERFFFLFAPASGSCQEVFCFRLLSRSVLLQAPVKKCSAPGSCQEVFCSRLLSRSVLLQAPVKKCSAPGSCQEVFCSRLLSRSALLENQFFQTHPVPRSHP